MIMMNLNLPNHYPEFLVAILNYAGGHAGHQIKILVAKNEIWSPRQN
jgi:predicted peptidase